MHFLRSLVSKLSMHAPLNEHATTSACLLNLVTPDKPPRPAGYREAEENARSAVSGLASVSGHRWWLPARPGPTGHSIGEPVSWLARRGCCLENSTRARYSWEYAAELWEIAQTGAGGQKQFKYAARQTLHR